MRVAKTSFRQFPPIPLSGGPGWGGGNPYRIPPPATPRTASRDGLSFRQGSVSYRRLYQSLDREEAARLEAQADRLEASGKLRAVAEQQAADRWRRAHLGRVMTFLGLGSQGAESRVNNRTDTQHGRHHSELCA